MGSLTVERAGGLSSRTLAISEPYERVAGLT